MKEPKIRFKGFSGEWKDLPFSEIVERTSSTGKTGSLPGIEFEDIVSGEGCLNKDVYQKDCRKYGKIFREGDILFGKLRPYLKNILLAEFRGIAIGDFWILRPGDNDSKFIYNLVNSEAFMRVANVSSGSKMPRADWNLVSSTSFLLPQDKVEQEAIGKYFTSLDAQISASTSRLASLKQVKAASLQAMFPQEGEAVPKVRFKGFEGEWKTRSLNNYAKKRTEKNVNRIYNVTLTNSAEFGIIDQRQFFDHDISNSENIDGYFVVRDKDFVYNPRISASAPVGPINQNKLGYPGVMSPLYLVFEVKGINHDFLEIYFHTALWHKYMFDNGNSGARFDRLTISDDDFMRMPIPDISLAEQQSIASFFTSLDRQIALHTQRLEKLKQIKAACLDKMFA